MYRFSLGTILCVQTRCHGVSVVVASTNRVASTGGCGRDGGDVNLIYGMLRCVRVGIYTPTYIHASSETVPQESLTRF